MTSVETGSPYIFAYTGALDNANCDIISAWVSSNDIVTNSVYSDMQPWEKTITAGSIDDVNVKTVVHSYRDTLVSISNTNFFSSMGTLYPESTTLLYWKTGNYQLPHQDAVNVAFTDPSMNGLGISFNSSWFTRNVSSITFLNDDTGGNVNIQVEPWNANTFTYSISPSKGTVVMFHSGCQISLDPVVNSLTTLVSYSTSNTLFQEEL